MGQRVLFVTTTYPLTPGDAIPSFVADLAEALVRDHGIRVRVIAPHHGGAAKSETVNGVEIERFQYTRDPARQCVAYGGGIPDNLKTFPQAKRQLPGFFAAMASAVWRHAGWADIIHAHWVEPALLAMIANWAQRPVVISVHSLKPRASRIHRWVLGRADRVLFNSQYTLTQAKEKGYFPCRAQVVYQGYDQRLFNGPNRSDPTIRAALNIAQDATLIVALGRMIEVKGLHILARAADRILEGRANVHLVIAGDGPMRAAIQNIINQSATRDRIHLPGALPRADVARLLASADLFVNPGIIDSGGRAEGLGITTIEAMASGLPSVGSRVGGIPETITDGETGILVPPGDEAALTRAITRLIDSPSERYQFAGTAQQTAATTFTWPVLAGQVADVYGEIGS